MPREITEDFNSLFNPNTEMASGNKTETTEYKPSAHKGQNNVYQSIIRFVPWYKNPKHGSIKDKWVSYLIDPVTQKGRYVDCPSSVGKPSPLQDMYFKLKKSESVREQKLADTFSRRHSYTALIQVIKDEQNKDLEGKILIWRFGIKIWEKLNAERNPVMGESHDPFNILEGKAFALKITKVSGYNNYDQSKFVDQKLPLCIPNQKGELVPIKPDSDKKKVFEWVKENSPDLDRYDYTEWDQEILDYVNHVINAVTGQTGLANNYASVLNEVKGNSRDQAKQPQQTQQPQPAQGDSNTAGVEVGDVNVEGLDDINEDMGSLPDLESEGSSDNSGSSDDDGIGGSLDDILKNS